MIFNPSGVPLAGMVALLLILGGCATTPPAPKAEPTISTAPAPIVRQFDLGGRVAVRYQEQGFSANLDWQHSEKSDQLLILNPLGQGVAQISRDDNGVTLKTADRRELMASDAEALTQQVLGWRLPLKGLGYWVVGAAAPGPVNILERDAAGRLARIEQEGWSIAYRDYRTVNGFDLPTRVELVRPELEIKLVADNWRAASR